MVNQKTFTKALTLFCLLVFFYTIIPADYNMIGSILKYIIIIFVIIILMMYNKILILYQEKEIEFQENKDSNVALYNSQINNKTFKKQFNFCKRFPTFSKFSEIQKNSNISQDFPYNFDWHIPSLLGTVQQIFH